MRLFDVDDILDGERDLDAVAVVVRPEDDPLQTLNPLLGALGAVGPEVVGSVVSRHREVNGFLVLVVDGRGDAVSQVDLALGEV